MRQTPRAGGLDGPAAVTLCRTMTGLRVLPAIHLLIPLLALPLPAAGAVFG